MARITIELDLTIRPRQGQSDESAAAELREELTAWLTADWGPLLEDYGTVWDTNGDPSDAPPWGGYTGPTIDHITVS